MIYFIGLLKPEFVSTNGMYCSLAPKSYVVTENLADRVDMKKGAKGNILRLYYQYMLTYKL